MVKIPSLYIAVIGVNSANGARILTKGGIIEEDDSKMSPLKQQKHIQDKFICHHSLPWVLLIKRSQCRLQTQLFYIAVAL